MRKSLVVIAVVALISFALFAQGNPYLNPVLSGATATGTAAIDFSGASGVFKTTTGASTFGGSANSFPAAGLAVGTAGSVVGTVALANATSGTITVTPPTGALGTITNTLPAVTGGIPVAFSCGSTGSGSQSCTPTAVNGQMHMYNGSSTLSSNAATITFPVAFTSTTSFFCVGNDVTTRANPVQMVPASASTATITNTTGASDVVQWICLGQ